MECLDSVFKSDYENYEIIVIDDASTDNTKDLTEIVIKAKFGIHENHVSVIHNPGNFKMVKSRNIGAKTAKGRYVLFIDDDNIFSNDMISLLVNFADKHPEFGIIGPSMYYKNGEKLYMNYQKINFFTGKTWGIKAEESSKEYFETDGVPNVFLIRKEVFEQAGYFDEALIQTFTEPDFAFNALKFGFKSCMVKKAKVLHKIEEKDNLSPRGLGGQFIQKAYCLMRNRTVIIARYANPVQKTIYFLFFSWAWPLLYSGLMIKSKRADLIKLYWAGFRDGIGYLFTGKLKNSLPELMK